MKKWLFRTLLSVTATAAMLQLSACGDDKNNIDDDEEEDVAELKGSSSSKGGSSCSSSVEDVSEIIQDVDQDSLTESIELAVPAGLTVVRLSPSTYQLSWNVESSSALTGFVFQSQALGSNAWVDEEKLAVDATMRRLILESKAKGTKYYNKRYRVAAFYGKTRSAYSEDVLASVNTEYSSDLNFPTVPTINANIERENTLEFMLTGNYPSKDVQYSVYNYNDSGKVVGSVWYEARFIYGSSYSRDTKKFSLDTTVVSKEIKEGFCNSYGQVRVVWQDRNGVKDSSDWSTPIGTKTGTTSGLSGDVSAVCADAVVVEDGFNLPTDLKAVSASGAWMLEWKYVEQDEHPLAGFVIQELNLDSSRWEERGFTNKGVTRYLVSPKKEYSYYRVAAKDTSGALSSFTEDVLITVTNAESSLNIPAITGASEYSKDSLTLAWTYEDNAKRPVKGFRIEYQKGTSWTKVGSVGADIRRLNIAVSSKSRTFRVVAFDKEGDKDGESASGVFDIPANSVAVYALAAPVVNGYSQLSDTTMALNWTYSANEKRPADSFVIEMLNLETNKWTSVATLKNDMFVYKIDVSKDGRYYRVGAKDADTTVYAKDEWYIPSAAQEAGETLLATPVMAEPATLTSGDIVLSWSYTNTSRPITLMYLQKFDEENNSWDSTAVSLTANRYTVKKDSNDRFFRIAACDAGGCSYSNDVKVVAASASVDNPLPAPVISGLTVISDTRQSIAWTYTASSDRPAKGFIVQKLDLTLNKWVSKDTLDKDIRRYTIDVDSVNQYWRVAAYAGDEFAYSTDLLVPGIVYELAAPSNLSATVKDDGSVVLSWKYTDNPKKKATGIRIDSVDFAGKAWATKTTGLKTSASYYKVDSSAQDRYFRVVAYITTGATTVAEAASEPILVAATSIAATVELPAPTGVAGTMLSSGKVRLTWSYAEEKKRPLSKFDIEKFNGTEWIAATTETVSSEFRSVDVDGPAENSKLYYRVVAVAKDGGESASSAIMMEYIKVACDLNVPANLKYTEVTSGTKAMVSISWTYSNKQDCPAENLKLQYLKDDNTWNDEKTLEVSDSRYTVESASDDRYYRVVATADGASVYSSDLLVPGKVADETTLSAPGVPYYTIRDDGKYEINWTYTQGSVAVDSFNIQTSADGKEYNSDAAMKGLSATLRKFVFDAPSAGAYYRVAAHYTIANKDSAVTSESIYIGSNADEQVLNAPVLNTVADMNRADGKYAISWTYEQGTLKADNFIVCTSADGKEWQEGDDCIELSTSVTTYVFDAPTEGMYYRVEAVSKGKDGAEDKTEPSNAIYISAYTVDLTLPAPTNLSAERLSPSVWVIKWEYTSAAKRPESGFRIQESSVSTGKWEETDVTKPSVLQYVVIGDEKRENFYRVSAFDGEGCDGTDLDAEECNFSDYSEVIQVTESTPYRSDLNFNKAPELDIQGASMFEGTGEDKHIVSAEVFVAVTIDQVAKSIVALPYTKKIQYEFRKITSVDATTGGSSTTGGSTTVYTRDYVKGDDGKTDGQVALKFTYDSGEKACYDAKGEYIQVRAKWIEEYEYTDANGDTQTLDGEAYTEWSQLYRIGSYVPSGCDG